MEKLSNTKYCIQSVMECLKPFLKEDLSKREIEYIESELKLVAENVLNDVRNSMSHMINDVIKLKIGG